MTSGHPQSGRLDELVLASLDEIAQPLEGVVDVREARIQRRQAEADRVGAAEVRDHPGTLDQGPADRPRLGVGEAHMPPAPGRVARAGELEAERGQVLVAQVDRELGEGGGLLAQGFDPRFPDQACTLLDGHQSEDRRRAREEAANARVRVVGAVHLELVALAEPAVVW
jgi:hypothetical protein